MENVECHMFTNNSSAAVHWKRPRYCSGLQPYEDYVVAAYLIIADLLAIPLNTMVLCLMYKLRQSFAPPDYFIVNLAMSDLGHPLLGYPMSIAAAFSHRWTFGQIGCSINGFLGFYFGVTSMTTLGVMSVVRYITVTRPAFVQRRERIFLCLLLIQSYSLFWAVTPLVGWGEYDVETYGLSCTLLWKHPNKSYLLCIFVFCLTLPVGAMTFSYFAITRISQRTRRQALRWKQNDRTQSVWTKHELRLLKVSIIMLSVFLLTWTPYAILSMVESFVPDITIPPRLALVPALCAKMSHILDPIIYFGMNKKFQRLARSMFVQSVYSETDRSSDNQTRTGNRMQSSFGVSPRHIIQMKVL